jgi:hypothetical protein
MNHDAYRTIWRYLRDLTQYYTSLLNKHTAWLEVSLPIKNIHQPHLIEQCLMQEAHDFWHPEEEEEPSPASDAVAASPGGNNGCSPSPGGLGSLQSPASPWLKRIRRQDCSSDYKLNDPCPLQMGGLVVSVRYHSDLPKSVVTELEQFAAAHSFLCEECLHESKKTDGQWFHDINHAEEEDHDHDNATRPENPVVIRVHGFVPLKEVMTTEHNKLYPLLASVENWGRTLAFFLF